ncbi:MAG: chaperone modulator CbpM [Elusimicrobiota bacterium]
MMADPERLRMLAAIMEIEPDFLEECIRHGALSPEDLAESTPSQLARLRRIRRICRGLEIDVFAGCIIVDLVDRMDGLQRELERLRAIAENEPTDL